MLLDLFDGDTTVSEIIQSVADSQAEAEEILGFVTFLHQRNVLIDEDFESKYFSNYQFGDHHSMLRDQPRMVAYRDAINEAISEDTRVADLGSGTGILTFFACQSGAKDVLSVEGSGWIDMASQLAENNELSSSITFMRERMERIALDEPVDLIVSECMCSLFIDARMLPHVLMFRDNNLADGGQIMPKRGTIHLAPVEVPEIHDDWVGRWEHMQNEYGIDFSALHNLAMGQSHRRVIREEAMLAEGEDVYTIDLKTAAAETPSFKSEVTFTVTRDGVLHGFAGYFTAWLTDAITLSTAPQDPTTHWQQHYFPLPAMSVAEGDSLACTFSVTPAKGNERRLDATLSYHHQRAEQQIGTHTAHYYAF